MAKTAGLQVNDPAALAKRVLELEETNESSYTLMRNQMKYNVNTENYMLSPTPQRYPLAKTITTPLPFTEPAPTITSNTLGAYNDSLLNISVAVPSVWYDSTFISTNTISAAYALPPPALYPTQQPPLPSLMCYVDNHLMQSFNCHHLPPNPNISCPLCQWQHNEAPFMTAFLPLSPCGHWVHYKCFIWWTTLSNPNRDKCPFCGIPLFKWEGITTLTLAARTGLGMQNAPLACAYLDEDTGIGCYTDQDEYELECKHIWNLIGKYYNNYREHHPNQGSDRIRLGANLTMPPKIPTVNRTSAHDQHPSPADGSLNLVQMYYDIFAELLNNGRPRCKWLKYETQLGYYLFAMLVSIKVRRYVEECAKDVIGSEGWRIFDDWGRLLQQQIMTEVRENTA